MPINVRLLDHTSDPTRSLYLAYRVAYSALTPQQIADRIASEKITREQMEDFIEKRLETGHASPLEQVWFEFGISGVSRAFSHQFVRHHVGISFEQQSQRYVAFKKGQFPYTIPDTVRRQGYADKMEEAFDRLGELYQEMIDHGVPAEDARFLIPNAANTNFKVTVNFLELLHICDLRLCTRAQWEFRQVASQMRAQINQKFPELAKYIQPKCGDKRWGYCDESFKDWAACPIGRKRPHRQQLFDLYDAHRRGELAPLSDNDFRIIEAVESSVVTRHGTHTTLLQQPFELMMSRTNRTPTEGMEELDVLYVNTPQDLADSLRTRENKATYLFDEDDFTPAKNQEANLPEGLTKMQEYEGNRLVSLPLTQIGRAVLTDWSLAEEAESTLMTAALFGAFCAIAEHDLDDAMSFLRRSVSGGPRTVTAAIAALTDGYRAALAELNQRSKSNAPSVRDEG